MNLLYMKKIDTAKNILRENFKLQEFKGSQEQIIERLLTKKNGPDNFFAGSTLKSQIPEHEWRKVFGGKANEVTDQPEESGDQKAAQAQTPT